MRYLILLWAAFFCIAAPAQAAKLSPADPDAVIKAALAYCLLTVTENSDAADFAVKRGLLEFAPEQAIKFAPDGGRVFALPGLEGNAVLMTSRMFPGACNIAVRAVSVKSFWQSVEKAFGAGSSFTLMREKRYDDERVTKRDYSADIKGPVVLLITASDAPRQGGMQALITFSRTSR
jgi:hypothetical protein